MDAIKAHISNITNRNKPNEKLIKQISKAMLSTTADLDLEEIAEELTRHGKTIVLGNFEGEKLAEGEFISQELVMLDFDNSDKKNQYTIDNLKKDKFILENACFYYRTFSDKNSDVDKFRVVFRLDNVITNKNDIKNIYRYLFNKYPMSDTSIGQANRMFFGGNQGYEIINLNNVLETEPALKGKESHLVISKNGSEIIDDNIPNYLLLKYGKQDIVKKKLGNNFQAIFPDDYVAMNYFKTLDMKELLELPEENPFLDIFHEEENPSASVYFNETFQIYLYHCFSKSSSFKGNIIQVLGKLLNKDAQDTVKLLVEITNSEVNHTSGLGKVKFNSESFKKSLMSGELNEYHPELYSYLKRYDKEISATLGFMFDYVYEDSDGELRYLNYYSIEKLRMMVGKYTGQKISIDKMKNILNVIVVTEIIQKLPEAEIPKNLYDGLISRQKRVNLRASNIYQPSDLSEDGMQEISNIAKKLKENNVTVSSLSYELVYRLFGEEKAINNFEKSYKPLVDKNLITMSKSDKNLTKKSIQFENMVIDILKNEFESKKFIYEQDLIRLLSRRRKSKINTTRDIYNKVRADVMNKYNLNRSRLTKDLYNKLGIEDKFTSKVVIYKADL